MSIQSSEREKKILNSAQEVLPSHACGINGRNIILSDGDAQRIGSAIIRRDRDTLYDIFSEPIRDMIDDYDNLEVAELKDEWVAAFQQSTGIDADLSTFLHNPASREALNDALVGKSREELGMGPVGYIKMLETLAIADAPALLVENGFKDRYDSPRYRRSGPNALFGRAVSILRGIAGDEPGIRKIREEIIEGNEDGIDDFAAQLSESGLANRAYTNIIDMFNNRLLPQAQHDVRDILFACAEQVAYDELEITHILDWTILPPGMGEDPNISQRLKNSCIAQLETPEHRAIVEKDWKDERVDFIFNLAHMGFDEGRNPQIYISSKFKGGLGFYLGVELDHPHMPGKKIVCADNPIHGNAVYLVDESNSSTDGAGRQYTWQEVLGEHKHLARRRGAKRRYHTGDWQGLAKKVIGFGAEQTVVAEPVQVMREEDIRPDVKQVSFDAIRFQNAMNIARQAILDSQRIIDKYS